MRRADFAEAYTDGVRAMIGDQVASGIDVPTDGHLWYDRHEGLISSFLLYPAYHLDGIDVLPRAQPDDGRRGRRFRGGLRRHLEQRGGHRAGRARHDAPGPAVGRGQRGEPAPGEVLQRHGPGQPRGVAHRPALPRQGRAVPDLADAYNAEFKDAVAAGVEIFQLDDVGFTLHAPEDYPLVVDTLNRALDGVDAFTDLPHLPPRQRRAGGHHALRRASTSWWPRSCRSTPCEYAFAETGFPDDDFALWSRYPSDKGLGIGVIDIKRLVVETPRADRRGRPQGARPRRPERIHLTTDCGQFALPRQIARGKLAAMAAAAEQLRSEIGS